MEFEPIKNAIDSYDLSMLRKELLPYLPKGGKFEFGRAKKKLLTFLERVLA
jgi:hypothetical protein